MYDIEVTADEIHVGAIVTVRFLRAGQPVSGAMGLRADPPVAPLRRLVAAGGEAGEVCVSVPPKGALLVDFSGRWWKPTAVRARLNDLDVVRGGPWQEGFCRTPQNFLVCPNQSWLVLPAPGADGLRPVLSPHGCGVARGPEGTEPCRLVLEFFEPKAGLYADGPDSLDFDEPDPVDAADPGVWEAQAVASLSVRLVTPTFFRSRGQPLRLRRCSAAQVGRNGHARRPASNADLIPAARSWPLRG